MAELNASDVLAMTRQNDGIFGGNGSWFIVLILFFLCMGGGWGGNSSMSDSLTRAELYEGLSNQDIKREIDDLSSEVCSGFSNTNTNLLNGFAGVNMNILNGTNNIREGMCSGFNSVNTNLNQLGFNMQQCCCDLKTTIHSEGEATRALIQSNLVQDLRDKIADKDRELLTTGLVTAQTIQTNNLENYIRTLINGCGCSA